MAVRTTSPWWVSALFAVGLVLVFIGERAFSHVGGIRLLATGAGALLVVATTALRLFTFARSREARRKVELAFVLCHAGALLALLLYVTTTGWGLGLFGIDAADAAGADRFRIPMTILWLVVLAASVVPLLMIELSLGTANRTHIALAEKDAVDDAAVELRRVSEMASSGLTMALAAALLMVTCNVADQRNIRKDLSYFKTSSPGSATVNMVESMSEPLRVLLFFPEVSEVKREVRGYFDALARAAGNVEVEEHDRMISAELAREHRVGQDGTIVLIRGDKAERLTVNPDFERARRNQLRTLDGDVQQRIMKVIREQRVAYLTVGHGEINDPQSLGPDLATRYPDAQASQIKRILTDQNYRVADLGLAQGLGNRVPEDATLVMVLGPREPLSDEALESLARYVAGGGALLVSLDPLSKATLGPLERRLGVRFDPTPITDDKEHLVRRGNVSDRRLILTNQFSSHASVTTMGRAGARSGILLVNAGHLVDAPFEAGPTTPKRTYVVRSMSTSWADVEDNLAFDDGVEKRDRYNLAAAIEDPGVGADGAEEHRGMRAMVFSDAEMFSDGVLVQFPVMQVLAADVVKWLGGEERFAGDTVVEKDVRIKHTRSEDVIWFYSTIVGAPLLVLGLGLAVMWWRRRSSLRRASS
jgi:hypothetical protein